MKKALPVETLAQRPSKRLIKTAAILVCASIIASCGGKDKGGGDGGGCQNCGPGGPGGGPGDMSLKPIADLRGALGLLVIDNSQGGAKLMLEQHNETVKKLGLVGAPTFDLAAEGGDSFLLNPESSFYAEGGGAQGSGGGGAPQPSGASSLQKVTESGEVKDVITVSDSNPDAKGGGGGKQPLPKVLTIAVSPLKDVYIHFERPFNYKEAPAGVNGWEMSSGYQCQIFKLKGGTIDDLKSKEPEADNMECVDNLHFIDNWRNTRNSVFQFDKHGNVYYPGSLPNGGKMVVYKKSRDGSQSQEMINSNICVQDFLVTKNGGVFYTGTSSCNGGGGGDGGFFRYVSPTNGGSVREIARGWWNFIFEPIAGATSDKAVFFGPDPRSSSTASWNTACIFKFDPEAGSTTADSTSNVITCGGDIWAWMYLNRKEDIDSYGRSYRNGGGAPSSAWKSEFKNRCESEGQVFAGGGSQISAIKQDSADNVYVIGNVRRKKKGTLSCRMEVRGPHCVVNGDPQLTSKYADATACLAAAGTWYDKGSCTNSTHTTSAACLGASATWSRENIGYNGASGDMCSSSSATASDVFYNGSTGKQSVTSADGNSQMFTVNDLDCQTETASSGGDQWTEEYKGFAKVNNTTKTLQLLSGATEQAINLWIVKDVPYYSSFDTQQGKYFLKRGTDAAVMAQNFETYNMSESGSDDKLFFDGLDFSNNSYTFGSIGLQAPFTKEQKSGLTGTVKTIVILPK